jgi:hypothetical protein
MTSVTQDNSAAQPANPTCSGNQGQCAAHEICDNKIDDNCDGLIDQCDPECNGCVDDAYEPNDTAYEAPMISPGSHSGLKICPCRSDWFSFLLTKGQNLTVTVNFTGSPTIDLDIKLYKDSDAQMNIDNPVASSTGTTSREMFTYSAADDGTYDLKVFLYAGDQTTYTIDYSVF